MLHSGIIDPNRTLDLLRGSIAETCGSQAEIFGSLVRQAGPRASASYSVVKPLSEQPQEEQLLAALIRNDASAASALLENPPVTMMEGFIRLAHNQQLACFLLDRLVENNVLRNFTTQFHQNLNELRNKAQREAATSNRCEIQFQELLKLVQDLTQGIIWIKGTALRHTLYEDRSHRHFADFDCVVKPEVFVPLYNKLISDGWLPTITPGFCNQSGVGPIQHPQDLLLSPCAEWIPTSIISLRKSGWPTIDIKLSPLDTGIQLVEIERFFADAVKLIIGDAEALVPSKLDSTVIALHTFYKDRFISWKTLTDLRLLIATLTESEWNEIHRRCHLESIESAAWASLSVCANRAPISRMMSNRFAPRCRIMAKFFLNTVSPSFVWNATSLPMLLAIIACSEDPLRRLRILARAFMPSEKFLLGYYGRGNNRLSLNWKLRFLLLHWLVLILPGGAIRRTFGTRFFAKNGGLMGERC